MLDERLADNDLFDPPVHPAAECVRLMTPAEFEALVDDIAENGLREPIKLGQIGNDIWLIDGRNRRKACEIAGVEPDYVTLQFADESALRAYVRSTNERRDLSKGERAMMLAMMYPDGGKPAPGRRDPAITESEKISVSMARVKIARQVLRFSYELACKVRDGSEKLDDALAYVRREQDRLNSDEAKLAALREGAPDLADLVDEERLTLAEADASFKQRIDDAERAEQNKRETLLRLTEFAYRGASAWSSLEFAEEVRRRLGDETFRTELVERLRIDEPIDLAAGIKALTKTLREVLK